MSLNIFVEGVDACGKTEISAKIASDLSIPRFKVETEKQNWLDGTFKHSLKFDALLPQFVRQTGTSFVSDRGYASEWVYSQVFGRDTDMDLLRKIDDEWATMAATHVICLRTTYEGTRDDELVPRDRLQALHEKYLEFAEWTSTDVIGLYVDKWDIGSGGYDISGQCKEVYAGLEAFKLKKRYRRVYDMIKNGEV